MDTRELLERRIKELEAIAEQVWEQVIDRQQAHQRVTGGLAELRMMLNRLNSEESEGDE